MKKRILAALLAACMALTLTACGGAEEGEIGSFGGTSGKLVEALRKDLARTGYEEMFAEEPEAEELAATDTAPAALRRSYTARGMTFEVYSLAESDEVYQAVLMADKQEADPEALDLMLDLFTDAFEQKEREELFEALSLPSTDDGIDKQAVGTIANWMYAVSDGFLTISATSLDYTKSLGL